MNASPQPGVAMRRYTLVAIVLHWVSALLIIGMLCLGYYMVGIPKGTPGRAQYFDLHKSFGVLTGVLLVLRLGWRFTHTPPERPAGMSRRTALMASWAHYLLYFCMVLQAGSGYVSSSFNKYGIKFFGLALPNWAWENQYKRELFMRIHEWVFIVLAMLIAVHVLAVFKHVFLDRDRVLQRMLP